MDCLDKITLSGEVWKSVNEFDNTIHDCFVVSNYGRVFRLPYVTSHNRKFPFREVSIKFHKNNHCLFCCGVGVNRKQLPLPLVVTYLFKDDFKIEESSQLKYIFKDGNFKNNHVDNIVTLYPLKQYPDLVWDFYERVSKSIISKRHTYALNNNLNDLTIGDLLPVFNEWKEYNKCFYYECPPTGRAFIKLISDTLKTVGLKGGIDEWLIYNNKNSFNFNDGEYFRYISNSGTFHGSRVECFVRNVYHHLGLIDSNFRQESFSEIINKEITGYNPRPDEFFIHPKNNKLVISETFGVAYNNNSNDERGNEYVKKSKKKYKIYSDFIFIDLWVKGLNMREVLNLMNDKLIHHKIIDAPILFTEKLLPKGEKTSIVNELNNLKDKIGLYTMSELMTNNKYIHRKLSRYCMDLDITPTKFLHDNVFKEIDLIGSENGVFSIIRYQNHNKTVEEIDDLVNKGLVTKPKDIYYVDTPLYWRYFRMVRSMDKKMSEWFNEIYPNVIRKDKNTILTENDVRWIKKNKDKMLQKEISSKFGVSKSTINDILNNRTWKHI